MKKALVTGALLILLPVLAFGDIIRPNSLTAWSDGSNVILTWTTDEEPNVARFEIEKRIGTTGEFFYIGSLSPQGPSQYQFVDRSTLKTSSTIYQYRIKIVFTNNASPIFVGPVTVNHSVSGVRRTWGSIKALFR
jgi:hypothetical protein